MVLCSPPREGPNECPIRDSTIRTQPGPVAAARAAALLFLLFFSRPASSAASPSLSEMRFLPGDDAVGPAAGTQWSPAVARGGGLLLAAWVDSRATGSAPDLFAARLDAAGALIDSIPIVVTLAGGGQFDPRVAWNGENWLVVWHSQVPAAGFYGLSIEAARVSPQGVVLDDPPIEVHSYAGTTSAGFALAAEDSDWCVVWSGTTPGEMDIRAARVSRNGEVRDPGGVAIVPADGSYHLHPDLAYAADEYLVTWDEWRDGSTDVLGARVTPALAAIDVDPVPIAGSAGLNESCGRIASNGVEFYVVWEATAPAGGGRVFGSRVNDAGESIEPGGVAISAASASTASREPCVAWADSQWVVAWSTPGTSVARVSADGIVLDPGGRAIDPSIAGARYDLAISATPDGGAVVAWVDSRAGGADAMDVYAAVVAPSGDPGAGSCITLGAPSQTGARIASDGDAFLAVFLSHESGNTRVVAAPLDGAGNALAPSPILVASGTMLGPPAVAYGGGACLVVWSDAATAQVFGRRFTAAGVPLDGAPFAIMPGSEPDVAALGGTFLVAGVNGPGGSDPLRAFARRVRASDGALLDPSPLPLGRPMAAAPRAGALGTRWLVAWECSPPSGEMRTEVDACFVDAAGTAGSEFPIRDHKTLPSLTPALASSGAYALVAWADSRQSFADWNVCAGRVRPDGTFLDGPGFSVTTAPHNQSAPAVAWDGREFLVLYEDARAATFLMDQRTDVYATRVDTAGRVIDPDGFAVSADGAPEIQPAVAASEGGTALLAASVFRSGAPHAAFRVGFRAMSTTPAPTEPTGVDPAPREPASAASLVAGPNPSTAQTTITVRLERAGRATLMVVDPSGREVARVFDGALPEGESRLSWDGRTDGGGRAAAGTYFVRLQTPDGRTLGRKVTRR